MKTVIILLAICLVTALSGCELVGKEKVQLQKDGLSKYDKLPTDVDLYVMKKNGTYDDRPNDLEELCKDFLYYRKKILEDPQEAADARATFQQVNADISEYPEEDVQRMFTLIENSGYKAP